MQLRGSSVTGVPTGFIDLDKLTSGLQGSNLVIVAARPSFGKTSFALNVAQSAAIEHQVPVAIFSLEMSKMELVQRLVCAEALVDVQKLRTGNLGDQDWTRLAGQVRQPAMEGPVIEKKRAPEVSDHMFGREFAEDRRLPGRPGAKRGAVRAGPEGGRAVGLVQVAKRNAESDRVGHPFDSRLLNVIVTG